VLHANARAADIPVGPSPILNAQLTSGSVTIRVWNRPQVRITTDGRIDWRYLTTAQIPHIPSEIDFWSQTATTPLGSVTLPLEAFLLPALPGNHDAVTLRGYGATTITMPAQTALIVTRIAGRGDITISDYRGTLVATTNAGAIEVQRVAGTAYLQVLRGRIFVADSTFDRVRARSGVGPVVFSSCSAGQIVETSALGAVIYDDGTLGQGPAHFGSEFGNVAVGISGAPAAMHHSPGGNTTVTFGPGSAVTASSAHGSVLTYSGALGAHRDLLGRWPRGAVLLRTHGPAPMMRPPIRRRRRF
jgi:hypothetical protein